MARLRDARSGAIVSVPEEKVARLGSNWIRIDLDEVVSEFDSFTVAELTAEIDRINAGREDEHKIVPESGKKAALIAALDADQAFAPPEITN